MNEKILVIGDLMLDEYIVGDDYHISDEAPVPIVKVEEFITKLGGAANVANNINFLGITPLLCGVIGHTENGYSASRFIRMMNDNNLSTSYIVQGDVKTTTKSRVIIKNQQVVRFDYEDETLPPLIVKKIRDNIEHLDFKKIKLIIVSDYNKGVITLEVMRMLKDTGVKIIIDPKPKNENFYYNTFCMTPNLNEFNEFTNSNFNKNDLDGIEIVAQDFINKLGLECIVITLGKIGAFCCDKNRCEILRSKEINMANTIGAGDTFVSALCYGIISGKDIFKSTKIAISAASVVVSKKYTSVCNIKEINEYIRKIENE